MSETAVERTYQVVLGGMATFQATVTVQPEDPVEALKTARRIAADPERGSDLWQQTRLSSMRPVAVLEVETGRRWRVGEDGSLADWPAGETWPAELMAEPA